MEDLNRGNGSVHNPNAPSAELQSHRNKMARRATIMANWDPTYPGENLNFYQEYIHRHAPVTISWFQAAQDGYRDRILSHEATGLGVLLDEGNQIAQNVVAPLDDGSVAIWDAQYALSKQSLHFQDKLQLQSSPHTSIRDRIDRSFDRPTQGRIIARSSIGLLTGLGPDLDRETRLSQSRSLMTETGAVECVSIDSRQRKGFFAVQDVLCEVDLQTLQLISRTPYPFPITALSEARHPTPLTVGTNWTLHLHDPRQPPLKAQLSDAHASTVRLEHIGGASPKHDFHRLITGDMGTRHSQLTQPGALSILHLPSDRDWDGNGDIWVAGRFTSLLNYDRRFFPRIRGTVHSGARISSLSLLPYPFVPFDLRMDKRNPNSTAFQQAKSTPGQTILAAGEYKLKGSLELYSLSTDATRSIISTDSRAMNNYHAFYHNRQSASSTKLLSVSSHGGSIVFSDGNGNLKWVERDGFTNIRTYNINEQSHDRTRDLNRDGADPALAATALASHDDIVQKIVPMAAPSRDGNQDIPVGQDNLLIWSGDGKIGMVGFGNGSEIGVDNLEAQAESAEELERLKREREYDVEMRRALERQAAELRWVRGYGLG
jgi:hypothetical protein